MFKNFLATAKLKFPFSIMWLYMQLSLFKVLAILSNSMRHFDQVAYMNQNVINFCFLGKIQVKLLQNISNNLLHLVFYREYPHLHKTQVFAKHSIAANFILTARKCFIDFRSRQNYNISIIICLLLYQSK